VSAVNVLKLIAVAVPIFLVIDLLWLGVVARGFYQAHMGHLLRPDVRWAPAIAFYLLFVAGIVVFVVVPALERESLRQAVGLGAFFGLVTYATYDLTNLATMRNFPTVIVVVDMIWGMVLSSVVATLSFKAAAWVLPA
jgi:uncharacterized membrane protein